ERGGVENPFQGGPRHDAHGLFLQKRLQQRMHGHRWHLRREHSYQYRKCHFIQIQPPWKAWALWVNVASPFPVAASQRGMAPTQAPEASLLPSGEKAMVFTASVWPLQTKRTLPPGRSWNLITPGDSTNAKDSASALPSGGEGRRVDRGR